MSRWQIGGEPGAAARAAHRRRAVSAPGSGGHAAGHVRAPVRRQVWSGGLVVLLAEFGFSHGAARVALTRLVRRGLITRVRSGRLVHYRITPRCERLLLEGDGRIFSLGPSRRRRRTWTLVWHQIPEDRRLGEAAVEAVAVPRIRVRAGQRVGVSARPCRRGPRAAVRAGRGRIATLFRASGEDASGLPRSLESLESERPGRALRGVRVRVRGVPEGAEGVGEGVVRRRSVTDQEAFVVRTRLVHLFREFPVLDPELPTDLAPPVEGPRRRAWRSSMCSMRASRRPPQRHFDDVTGASPLWR